MGFTREVDLGPSFAPLEACRNYFGYIPAVYRAQTLLPRALASEIGLEHAILYDAPALSHRQKERLLLVLAWADANVDIATSRYQMLLTLGEPEARLDSILNDYRQGALPPDEVELIAFGLKLSATPASIAASDISDLIRRGRTAKFILDAVLVSAWYRFLACISHGTGALPDFPPLSVAHRVSSGLDVPSAAETGGAGPYLPSPPLLDSHPAAAIFREHCGFVPNVFLGQSARPEIVQAEAVLLQAVLFDDTHLSRRQKEQIVIAVSAANRNDYFVAAHSEFLAALGVSPEVAGQIALAHRHAGLSEPDLALLDFALVLTAEPSSFGAIAWNSLRTYGYTDEHILEVVLMTALTNFLSTVQFGIGAVPDFEPRIALPASPPKIPNLSDTNRRPTAGGVVCDPDTEAVSRVRNGDSVAFEDLVTRHSRRVYRMLLGILGSPEEARDAMQDTFLKAYQHLDKFEGRSKFSTWLVSIAGNTALQILRDRKQLDSIDEQPSDSDETFRPRQVRAWADDPEQLFSKSETRALVEQGVMRLPAKYRVVLMLRDIEQLSIDETATALNLGIPAVKSRHLRGRLMLREALTPHFAAGAKGGVA